jgi:magnesium-transporting ATPase (P-type)
MLSETPSITQLSQVIAQVTAPAFLLGAVAAFTSVLMARMNRVLDRSQVLNTIADDDPSKAYLKADIPRLRRRAALLNRAIFLSTMCAIVTALLIVVAFATAFFQVRHEYGVALLFVVALAFFIASLANLARETRVALHEFDHHK